MVRLGSICFHAVEVHCHMWKPTKDLVKTLIFGLFGHFHTEVNPEMIPNQSWWAAKI
jgi:hypothetical protein